MADTGQEIVAPNGGGLRHLATTIGVNSQGLAPKSLAELMDFAQLMAKAGPMVGKAFRGEPGACLAIAMQAMRWNMDPFAVSQKAYVTGESIAYEAQLVNAVILTHAPIVGRPSYTYTGTGNGRRCTVSVLLRGDTKPSEYTSPETVPGGNSPLWKKDLDQQLGYYSIRAWARRYCPETIMGVYTPEEIADAGAIDGEVRVVDHTHDAPALTDGGAKSSHRAKKDGDGDWIKEKIAAFKGPGCADDLRQTEQWMRAPKKWRDGFEDMIEAKLEELAYQDHVRENDPALAATEPEAKEAEEPAPPALDYRATHALLDGATTAEELDAWAANHAAPERLKTFTPGERAQLKGMFKAKKSKLAAPVAAD